MQLKADGSLDRISGSRRDLKDNDPKYQKIIKEVDDEVRAEIKRKALVRKFAFASEFWPRKKEKLKEKGIEWRSPAELNPHQDYDLAIVDL